MVELTGALSNPEVPVRWRELARKHRKLRKQALASSEVPEPAKTQPQPDLWLEITKIRGAATRPLTPREIQSKLETRLGRAIPPSSVKSCLLRNVSADGPLQRRGRGAYVLSGPVKTTGSTQGLRLVHLWPHIVAVLEAATEPLSPGQVQKRLAERGKSFSVFRVNDCLMRHVAPRGPLVRDKAGRYLLPAEAKGERAARRRRRGL